MCRLTVYKGKELLLGDLIVKPENSLVCQSRDAGYHPGVVDKAHLRNIRVNGDGFGVAFYGNTPEMGSCLFKFVTPAWSNKNLINLGGYVRSTLIMGHIRAATSGADPLEPQSVSIENCHPFKFNQWTFMHNGGIPRFSKIKLALLNLLCEECFHFISGSTDSEHIFALFLSLLPDRSTSLEIEVITAAVEQTIATIIRLCDDAGVIEPCSLNLCITDGIHVIATRFRNSKDCPPSLYYNYGSQFIASEGTFLCPGDEHSCEIVISSAPLCREYYCEDFGEDQEVDCGNWVLAPKNAMLVCVGDQQDNSKINSIYIRQIITSYQGISDMPKDCTHATQQLSLNASIVTSSDSDCIGVHNTSIIGTTPVQSVFPSPNLKTSNPSPLPPSLSSSSLNTITNCSDAHENIPTLPPIVSNENAVKSKISSLLIGEQLFDNSSNVLNLNKAQSNKISQLIARSNDSTLPTPRSTSTVAVTDESIFKCDNSNRNDNFTTYTSSVTTSQVTAVTCHSQSISPGKLSNPSSNSLTPLNRSRETLVTRTIYAATKSPFQSRHKSGKEVFEQLDCELQLSLEPISNDTDTSNHSRYKQHQFGRIISSPRTSIQSKSDKRLNHTAAKKRDDCDRRKYSDTELGCYDVRTLADQECTDRVRSLILKQVTVEGQAQLSPEQRTLKQHATCITNTCQKYNMNESAKLQEIHGQHQDVVKSSPMRESLSLFELCLKHFFELVIIGLLLYLIVIVQTTRFECTHE